MEHVRRNLHGNNVGLTKLLDGKGADYFRANMKFALLEFWSMRTDDGHVLERESCFKDVLHARALGHNKNRPIGRQSTPYGRWSADAAR